MEEKSDLRKGSTRDPAEVMVKSFKLLKGTSLVGNPLEDPEGSF